MAQWTATVRDAAGDEQTIEFTAAADNDNVDSFVALVSMEMDVLGIVHEPLRIEAVDWRARTATLVQTVPRSVDDMLALMQSAERAYTPHPAYARAQRQPLVTLRLYGADAIAFVASHIGAPVREEPVLRMMSPLSGRAPPPKKIGQCVVHKFTEHEQTALLVWRAGQLGDQ